MGCDKKLSVLSSGSILAPKESVQQKTKRNSREGRLTPADTDVSEASRIPKEKEKIQKDPVQLSVMLDDKSLQVYYNKSVAYVKFEAEDFDKTLFRVKGDDVDMFDVEKKKFFRVKEKTQELWSLKIRPSNDEVLLYINYP